MDGMLSQDEINALLSGANLDGGAPEEAADETLLTDEQKDALGEVANISMGTAATTLSTLLNQTVNITTPNVSYMYWDDLADSYDRPCVFLSIQYTCGLDGNNVLVLKERDVKIITDLMMGGAGVESEEPISELHLSAIGEAMNQMMGSAATSMSTMLGQKIDISPPVANLIDLNEKQDDSILPSFLNKRFIKVAFRMTIGDLIDSEIMQLYPFDFAENLCETFSANVMGGTDASVTDIPAAIPAPAPAPAAPEPAPMPQPDMTQMQQGMMGMPQMQPMPGYGMPQPNVNVQPAAFQAFTGAMSAAGHENIDLIMDVPLEVTVELGRTSKSIKEILEFAPGTIVELNKIAGEPIDVLVNGKYVAKGEVVVIEESFGVKITEIIK